MTECNISESKQQTEDEFYSIFRAENADKLLPPFVIKSRNGYKVLTAELAEHFRKNKRYFWQKTENGGKPLRFIYHNGVYKPISDDELRGAIKKCITDFDISILKMRDVDEVFRNIVTDDAFIESKMLNADENIINFENGLLYLDTMELKPHTPEVLTTIQIPCKWNDNGAPAPVFEKYLNTLTNGNSEIKELLLQFIGAVISSVHGPRTKSVLFMVGAGNTGKSQLKNLVEKLIGSRNHSAVNINALEGRFGLSKIYGKRLIGSSDMSFMTVSELNNLKQIAGGDPLDVEFKGRDSFDFKYSGFIWYCMNQLPKFGGDHGDWVYDRLIIVRCENVIPEGQRDRYLLDKMYEEREAIVYIAIQALKRLLANGCAFTVPEQCLIERKQYKKENSLVLSFYDECCCNRPNDKITDDCTCARVHAVFKAWCKDNGNFIPSKQTFRRELAPELGVDDIKTLERTIHGYRYYPFTLNADTKNEYRAVYGTDTVH